MENAFRMSKFGKKIASNAVFAFGWKSFGPLFRCAAVAESTERDRAMLSSVKRGNANKSYQSARRDIFPLPHSVLIPLLSSQCHAEKHYLRRSQQLTANRLYCTEPTKRKMVSNKCMNIADSAVVVIVCFYEHESTLTLTFIFRLEN